MRSPYWTWTTELRGIEPALVLIERAWVLGFTDMLCTVLANIGVSVVDVPPPAAVTVNVYTPVGAAAPELSSPFQLKVVAPPPVGGVTEKVDMALPFESVTCTCTLVA